MSDNVEILIKKAAEIATQQNQLINYQTQRYGRSLV
mgnify:FL=1|jgi:hypothetical protein|nr:MAG TPA: hypothetical protein [Caudoviricetes sp.]